MPPKTFHWGANYKVVGKCDAEKLSYPGAWEVSEGTLLDLALHIGKGHPWMPALLDGDRRRLQSNSNYAEVIAADIDGLVTIPQAQCLAIVRRYCGLGIESSSSTLEHQKFRLIFRLNEPITDWRTLRAANRFLIHGLSVSMATELGIKNTSEGVDPACKDASRYFFGGLGREYFLLDDSKHLPEDFVAKAIAWRDEQDKLAKAAYEAALAERARRRAENPSYDPEADVWEALTYIGPYTPGEGRYNDLVTMIAGIVNDLGDRGYRLLEDWDNGRGQWGRPFQKQVESVMRSHGGVRPASLGTLFHLAKQEGYRPQRQPSQLPGSPALPELDQNATPEQKEQAVIAAKIAIAQQSDLLRDSVADLASRASGFERAILSSAIRQKFKIPQADLTGLVEEVSAPIRSRPESIAGLHDSYLSKVLKAYENPGGFFGYSMGLPDVDKHLGLICPEDLVVIMGRPGSAKTTVAQHIMKQISGVHGDASLFFSMEMSKTQIMDRIVSDMASVNGTDIRFGRINDNNLPQILHAMDTINSWPIHIDDNPGIDSAYIHATSYEFAKSLPQGQRLGCIIVDYIQLIEGTGDNRNSELSKISRSLKNLAKTLGTSVIALAQANRGCEARMDKRPLMSDIRDCGEVEAAATAVIGMYRDEIYNPDTVDRGIIELIVRKNRFADPGTGKCLYSPEFSRFSPLTSPQKTYYAA